MDHDRLKRVRQALHEDAVTAFRAGWSAWEWEESVCAVPDVLEAYADRAVLERELDAFARLIWFSKRR